MNKELTSGNVQKTMLIFAGPMILGNLLQQCYNIADTLIVGRFIGAGALASVGAAYTLMTFLTSVLIGLCMGSGSVIAFYFGKNDETHMKKAIAASFLFIGAVSVVLNVLVFACIDGIIKLLRIPKELNGMMREYVWIIFWGILFVFLYNYFAFVLRAIGNSAIPLLFLAVSAVANILLDYIFVVYFHRGIGGAAEATVISQILSGAGIGIYTWLKEPMLRIGKADFGGIKQAMPEVVRFSVAASVQQSVMNFGILMIQGLVNSFGTNVMAAFAVAVKIDSFAYMPAQEFANAFSIFISQNFGAGKKERVKAGVKSAVKTSVLFCVFVSVIIFIFAPQLMQIFVDVAEKEIINIGTGYLHVEGSFYLGIGILFLLYGYYRAIGKPEMSVILTVISLGTRVLLAYVLAPIPQIGVWGIWWAIPIGWFLADMTGLLYLKKVKIKLSTE
ncbi:MAG: MATE family efflux transporter [Lachnospiraceae bacterium]